MKFKTDLTPSVIGTLSIVSVPIGHPKDITLRAIEVLDAVDVILCEDLKPARRLLHELKIEKELLPLNEHTSAEATVEALDLLMDGKHLALISDAGTPVIADPGFQLVRLATEQGISVSPIPGASSILAALVVSGFSCEQFLFAGFLPRDKDARKRAAAGFRSNRETLIFLEAPYRLGQLLDDLVAGIDGGRQAALCMDLTLPKERVRRDTLFALRDHFREHPWKGEFVLVVDGASGQRRK